MLLKPDTVHNAWAANQRTVSVKLTIKGTEYDASDITSLRFDSGAMNGEALTLGSTYQNTIKVVFSHLIEGLALTDEIAPKLGIKLPDGTWDYTPLGVFVIDAEVQQDRNNNTTTVSASDRMCMMGGTYESKLIYPAAINDIAVEIANLATVKLNEDDFARLPTDKVVSFGKVTYRDAIGFVAQFAGGFATFDRDGLLDIRQLADPSFEVAPSQYQSEGLTKNEALYRIGGIACTVTTTTKDDSGNETQDTSTLQSGSTAGTQITISNPGMTQDLLDGLYEQLQDLNFYPFSLSWFGDPNVEAGDWIEVQDTADNTFKTPNLLYSLTFAGGVTATSKADTTVSASANFVYKGQLNQIVENIRQYLNASGQQVSEGIDEPLHPKAGDVWFKKSGPDTFIMMYKIDPETGTGSWVEEVSTKGVSGLDEELKAAKAKLNADILAAQANLATAQKDVAALQTKLATNDQTQAQLTKDLSANSTILAQAQADIVANTQSLSDLDTKLKANDDIQAQLQDDLAANTKVQDQLTADLAANTKLITANKESVDAALVTVNKTLTQAQTDTATAVKNADLAVTNAQSAIDASGLATQTANAANDAATAAKNLATSTANDFATVQSQAATAASDAANAKIQATNALGQANTAIGNAADALNKVNGISVGGTNLIIQSELKSGYINRDTGGIYGSGSDFHSDNYIATNGETVFTLSSPDYVFKGSTNHTLAMYDSDKNYLGWQSITSATQTLSKPNVTYIRFSINFTSEGGTSGNLSDWLDSHRYKLEKGNIATDWSPAPEDVQIQIDKVNGELSQKVSQTTYNVLAGTVDTVSTLATQNQSTIKTLATSDSVDAVSGRVTTAQALAEQTANGLTLKADSSTVDTLSDTVKQQGIDLEAAQGELKLKLTQSDLSKGLDGYATQSWAQNQISATANGWETKLSNVTQRLSNDDRPNLMRGDWQDLTKWTSNGPAADAVKSLSFSNGTNNMNFSGVAYQEVLAVKLPTKRGNQYVLSVDFTGPSFSAIVDYDWGAGVILGLDLQNFVILEPGVTNKRYVMRFEASGDDNLQLRFGAVPDGISLDFTFANFNLQLDAVSQVTTTEFSDLKLTVDGFTGTFATKDALGTVANQLNVTSQGLSNITTAIGENGETVTALRSDVNGISGTISNYGQLTASVQTLQGFQQTATSDISGLQATQTLMASQWKSTIGSPNLIYNSEMIDNFNGWTLSGNGITAPTYIWGNEDSIYPGAVMEREGDPDYWNVMTSKAVPAKPGAKYSIYCMGFLSSSGGTSPWFYIELQIKASDGTVLSSIPAYFDVNSKETWQEAKSESIVMPENTAYVVLNLVMYKNGLVKFKRPMLVQDSIAGPYRPYSPDMSQITQLQSQIDLRTTVAGKVTAALNLSNDGGGTVTIRGASLYVTAASHFDAASIQSAAIANLDAAKITSGSISADRLATTELNADNLTSGSIAAARIASTAINADNITSGSIAAARIATTALSATNITSGTFDASKMTVKNINAGSITSGSIATALLASTEINADNLTSGSIAAARIATTALSATNIVSGTLDVGKLTVKNLSADLIASGTIDASKITVKNLSASNIIGGELDAGLVNVKNLNADNIITGTLNAGLVNVIGLNASAITTGTISGANLEINLNTGEVLFTKGSIKSIDGHLNIDVNDGTFAQSDGTKGMMFAKGNLYLSSSSWWDQVSNPDAAPKPDYGFIGYTDTVLTERGFGVIGRDALTLGLTDNGNPGMEYTSSPVITMSRSNVVLDFSGELATIQAGKGFTIPTNPYYSLRQTPGIQIGSNVDRSGIGDRVFIDGSYVYIPSAYSRTSSGSANLIVAADGAIVRTSSATKYKSNIERFRSTDMGEALLNMPQAHWYNKGDMQRYVDDPQHYSMPELDYGMIAEDLAAAGLEDLVVRGDDGQLEDIRYDRIAPALLPLLAKMKQEIEELKSAAKSA